MQLPVLLAIAATSLLHAKNKRLRLRGRSRETDAWARTVARAYDEGHEFARILKDDIMSPMAETLRRHAQRPVVAINNPGGTSVTCYELGGTGSAPRLGEKVGPLTSQTVCVFERICLEQVKFIDPQHRENSYWQFVAAQSPLLPTGRYDFPPSVTRLSGASKLVVKPSLPAENQTWTETPTWLMTHSFARHTTHFLEHVAPMFMATTLISKEKLNGLVQSIRLVNHAEPLGDWQKGVLAAAAQLDSVDAIDPILHLGPEPTCYQKACIPGFVFELFEEPWSARAFKQAVYGLLKLPLPAAPGRQVTFLHRSDKRRLANEDELVQHVQQLVPVGVAVEVVSQATMSFRSQVATMAKSGLIIGIHGADLTNCVFQAAGSVMIEVNPADWQDARFLRACGTNDVNYLSYNDAKQTGHSWPWAHFPSVACPKLSRALMLCDDVGDDTKADNDVVVDRKRFTALFLEAMSLLRWTETRAVYSPFPDDFALLGVARVRQERRPSEG